MAGILSGMLSAAMVLGQLTMFSQNWSFSMLHLLFESNHGFWITQAFCFVPLSYMVGVVYWSLFRLKIAGLYGLYDSQNTDTGSLLWCSSVLARLTAPLCYHFLLLVQVKDTSFQDMLNEMEKVPVLGGSFNTIFPVLVVFLCVCNLLNVYSKLVGFLNLESLEVEWAPPGATDSNDLLTEGRRLVDRERRRRSEDRSLLELHDRNNERRGDDAAPIPLRLQIQAFIEDGTLPMDWNAHAGP